jgi:hypothetical protein
MRRLRFVRKSAVAGRILPSSRNPKILLAANARPAYDRFTDLEDSQPSSPRTEIG